MRKLKQYTPKEFPILHGRQELVFLTNGTIRFSKAAIIRLGLEKGAQIVFLQDEQRKTDWYISKVEDGGFEIKGNRQLEIRNKGLVSFIMKELREVIRIDIVNGKFKIPLGETENEITALITKNIKC